MLEVAGFCFIRFWEEERERWCFCFAVRRQFFFFFFGTTASKSATINVLLLSRKNSTVCVCVDPVYPSNRWVFIFFSYCEVLQWNKCHWHTHTQAGAPQKATKFEWKSSLLDESSYLNSQLCVCACVLLSFPVNFCANWPASASSSSFTTLCHLHTLAYLLTLLACLPSCPFSALYTFFWKEKSLPLPTALHFER